METLSPRLWIDANVIDCWAAILNHEELVRGCSSPRRHFFPTGCITKAIIEGTVDEEQQWKVFSDDISAQFEHEVSSISLSEVDLKKFFARHLKNYNNPKHISVAKLEHHIPKLKWSTTKNHSDYEVFMMIQLEHYFGKHVGQWDLGLCEESDEHVSMLRRMSETVFQTLSGHDLSSVRLNMETLSPRLWIDANVIDCWAAILNHEELVRGCSSPRRHFFPTGCITKAIIEGTVDEEQQWKVFSDDISAQFEHEVSSISLSEVDLVFFLFVLLDIFMLLCSTLRVHQR
nr:hypothetical protein [Tanacetum cinerariifolium]